MTQRSNIETRPHCLSLQSIVEQFNPPGLRNYWKSAYLRDLGKDLIDVLVEHYAQVPSPQSHMVLYTLGGAVCRTGGEDTAVAYRDARHILLLVGMWARAEDDAANRTWVREPPGGSSILLLRRILCEL